MEKEPPLLYKGKISLTRPTVYPIGSQYGEKSKLWLRHLDENGAWKEGKDKDSYGNHRGTDFLTPIGSDIRACSDGFIIKAGYEVESDTTKGFGLRIIQIIVVDDIRYLIYYGHLSQIFDEVYAFAKSGQKVKEGQLLAKSGASGRVSGPHLHCELRDLNQTSLPVEWRVT